MTSARAQEPEHQFPLPSEEVNILQYRVELEERSDQEQILVQQPTAPSLIQFSPAFAQTRPAIVSELEIQKSTLLCPSKWKPSLRRISTSKVLKYGTWTHLGEAEAMVLVANEKPTVSLPEVYNAWRVGDVGFIIMEFIPGPTVGECWRTLSEAQKRSVVRQLRDFVMTWRQIRGKFFGTVDGGPCRDSIFLHPYYWKEPATYGPYASREEFNRGAVEALLNSRPLAFRQHPELERRILETRGEEKVFTHGDLNRGNMIFHNGRLHIIDWGQAGYSVPEREYTEMMWQASLSKDWRHHISGCVPEFPEEYTLWDRVVNEMRLFTGI